MYFYKFMKWFWTEYLDETSSRVGVGLLHWLAFLVPVLAFSLITGHPVIMGYFMGVSIAVAFLIAVSIGIMHIYECYQHWESRVFNKLRGTEE